MTTDDDFLIRHSRILFDSYQHWTGKELLPSTDGNLVQLLLDAPFAVLSHGIEADPILNYSNHLGLQLFGYPLDELKTIPSRLTAEPVNQEARAKLLAGVTANGYVSGYSGVRIAKNGQRFLISNTTVWNLLDERGEYYGQAALIEDYLVL